MGLPAKLLGADEHEVMHLRTHGFTLVGPALAMVVTAVGVGVGLATIPSSVQPWAGYAVAAVASVVLITWTILPFLRWLTTTYTITDRRIITRRGIVTKSGHDLPLARINDVNYSQSLLDRMLGRGTLLFTTAAADPVRLRDIPHVERVHLAVTEMLFAHDADAARDEQAGNP
jgi:uncharacterized membrane protein YdbT with pleckstrin-like domain